MERKHEVDPGRILGISGGYWQPCALHAGVKLNIFSLLAENRRSAAEVAEALGAPLRGVELLLNALAAMGLLDKEGDRFINTVETEVLLNSASPAYIGHMVMHHHHLVDGWSQLDRAVLAGGPVETRSHGEERERESFLLGMHTLAMAIAPSLSRQIDLTGRRRLLDVGGGPGTHAVHFCLANPELSATVFDRAATEAFARKTAERFGVADRVDFTAGDFVADSLPGGYDVVWLSQVLHSNSPEDCRRLVGNAVAALAPGGLILIHDFLLDDTMAWPLFPALFSLNMLQNNQGRDYSEGEVRAMLAAVGVRDIVRLAFRGPNDSGVLRGIAG